LRVTLFRNAGLSDVLFNQVRFINETIRHMARSSACRESEMEIINVDKPLFM
jgi:hypothetical protein